MIELSAMKRSITFLSLGATLAAFSAIHTKAEMLRTMPHGYYECALPGDAASHAWKPIKDASFTIGNASSYRNELGDGTYLLKGDTLTFTRGPKKGLRLRRTGANELQAIGSDGTLGRMLCVRVSQPFLGSRLSGSLAADTD